VSVEVRDVEAGKVATGRCTRGIVFDFDGVLVDTEQPEYLAWKQLWAGYGHELPLEDWSACIGAGMGAATFDPVGALARLTGRDDLVADELHAQAKLLASEVQSQLPVMPGVAAWLDAAQGAGIPVAIASSSPRRWVVSHLARLGLTGRFPVIASFDDCGAKKPDPASYALACGALGATPACSVAVEDSLNGLLAAKAAGMRCVVVPNVMTAHMDFAGADLVLGSLAEIGPLAVMERLGLG